MITSRVSVATTRSSSDGPRASRSSASSAPLPSRVCAMTATTITSPPGPLQRGDVLRRPERAHDAVLHGEDVGLLPLDVGEVVDVQQVDGDQPLLPVEVEHQRAGHQGDGLGDGGQQQVGVGPQLHPHDRALPHAAGAQRPPGHLRAGDGEVDEEVPDEPHQRQRPHARPAHHRRQREQQHDEQGHRHARDHVGPGPRAPQQDPDEDEPDQQRQLVAQRARGGSGAHSPSSAGTGPSKTASRYGVRSSRSRAARSV